MRHLVSDEIEKMLTAGFIEPATSEQAFPVVTFPNKYASLRFCVDYRNLNAETLTDTYPLRRMDDCLDSLGEAQIFKTLDARNSYWQVPINDADRFKTTFTSHMGTYRYNRMPFGLKNAPATFQLEFYIILSEVHWQTCVVYLDDLIGFS